MAQLLDFLEANGGTPAHVYERIIVPGIFDHWSRQTATIARPGDKVLDVACGTGSVTRYLAERAGDAGEVVGLDFLENMLDAAREFTPDHLPIRWVQDTALALPFGDASFDVVVCQQGLQFMPDKVQAMAEMWRVLRPGGKLRVLVWCGVEAQPHMHVLEGALLKNLGPEFTPLGPFTFGDEMALTAVVRGAGIKDFTLERGQMKCTLPSVEDFVFALICGVFRGTDDGVKPGLFDLADVSIEPKVASLMDDMRAGLGDLCLEDGSISAPMASHIVNAVRPA